MKITRVLVALAALGAIPCFGQPTYSKDVSRIFQTKCQQCHRANDIAPFTLKDYGDALAWSLDIARVVDNGSMPPWKPVAGYGEFRDAFPLSADERQTILDWVTAGAPEGDSADLPDPLPERGEWALGTPDLILPMVQEFAVPRGSDVYRCFVLPATFDTTQYATAFDVIPGARKVVHHVLLFSDPNGDAVKLEGQDGRPGYDCFGGPGIALSLNSVLAGWAPGQRTHALPDGVGVQLAKGSRIVMQVHYFPNGRGAIDLTRVGVYLTKTPVQRQLINFPMFDDKFKIPANAADHHVEYKLQVPEFLAFNAISVYPHMHLLGTQIKVDVTGQDGTVRPMIWIDKWDFNYQGPYTFVEPMAVKAGDTVKLTCTYNNTDSNPRNPNNPIVSVGWGERTTDEMCLAFIGLTLNSPNFLPVRKANPRR